jgi:DNA-binding XRE family transcriptional regulator
VAFRIFPEHVEVDVLHSDSQIQAGLLPNGANPAAPTVRSGPAAAPDAAAMAWAAEAGAAAPGAAAATPAEPVALGQPGQPATFAEWMSTALRRQGLTQEAAARQLGVSVKTVSRWVGGATEPRMRDLRRIQEVFGEVPLP